MAKVEPTTEQKPLFEIHGSEGLTFSPSEEEKQPASEEKPQDKNGEEVLSLEEFQQKYPNVKIKRMVAGEEVVRSPKEWVDVAQRFDGLERTSERKAQETARLLSEVRQEVSKARLITAPPAEPEDPNDPTVFVKNIVRQELDPRLATLDQKVNLLSQVVAPDAEEFQVKRAKALLKVNGISHDDFDALKEPVIQFFEKRIGRAIESSEVPQISAEQWMMGYLVVSKNSKPKEPEPPKKPEQPKIVVKREGPSGGGGGYPPAEATFNKDLEEAQRTNDFSKIIMQRIKPRTQGE